MPVIFKSSSIRMPPGASSPPPVGGGGPVIADGSEFLRLDFTNLTADQSITSMVSFWGAQGTGIYAGGTSGCYGDTSVKRTGKNSSLRMSVISGSTGRPGDGANAAEGDYGFLQSFPSVVTSGGYARVGAWVYFPTGFSFLTDTGFLKFLRIGTNTSAKHDLEVLNGILDGLSPNSDPYGFCMFSETQAQAQSETCHRTTPVMDRASWHWVEFMVKAHATAASTERRFWIDDVMIFESFGTSMTYRDRFGVYQTVSFATAVPTIGSGGNLANVFVNTYWNGGAPANQSSYIDTLIISNNNENASDMVLDSRGNKMIGSAYV